MSFPVINDGGFIYEVGWCAQHNEPAKRYEGDHPSFNCWWECIVETSVIHRPEDFVPIKSKVVQEPPQ